MRQRIAVSEEFNNLSSKIKIRAVYQKESTLIAVLQILPTDHMGEAVYTSKDSCVVETTAATKLPVQFISLGQGKSLADIPEINGLHKLPRIASVASGQGMFLTDSDAADNSQRTGIPFPRF